MNFLAWLRIIIINVYGHMGNAKTFFIMIYSVGNAKYIIQK